MNRIAGTSLICLALLGMNSCGFLDEDPQLDSFIFEEQTHGITIQPGVDVASIGPDIALVGVLNTPTPCYRLIAEFEDDDSDLNLRVIARPTTSSCDQIIGNFRYQGSIRNLDPGTYQFRIRHVFEGANWPEQTFNVPVTIR